MHRETDEAGVTREEITKGFHEMYQKRIADAGGPLAMEKLSELFNETLADYIENLMNGQRKELLTGVIVETA